MTSEEKRNLIVQQIEFQNKIQRLGFNLVNCGNCGGTFFHKCDDNGLQYSLWNGDCNLEDLIDILNVA